MQTVLIEALKKYKVLRFHVLSIQTLRDSLNGSLLAGFVAFSSLGVGSVVAQTSPSNAPYIKQVGPGGVVNYTDVPLTSAGARDSAGDTINTTGMPFALQKAVQSFRVTLYTSSKCGLPCVEARGFLQKRGVPFIEKTVESNEDIASVSRTFGVNHLPVAMLGRDKQTVFNPDVWNQTLDVYGYPPNNQLPPTYRPPAPSPVVPPKEDNVAAGEPPGGTPNAAPGTAPNNANATPPPASGGGTRPPWFKGF